MAVVRAGLTTGAAIGGAITGGAPCASETVASLGIGVVECPLLVIGGSAVGTQVGNLAGDALFGQR